MFLKWIIFSFYCVSIINGSLLDAETAAREEASNAATSAESFGRYTAPESTALPSSESNCLRKVWNLINPFKKKRTQDEVTIDPSRIEILKKARGLIAIFERNKVGDADAPSIIDTANTPSTETVDAIVQELQQVIKYNKRGFPASFDFEDSPIAKIMIPVQKEGFEIIDFMVRNSLTNPDRVWQALQDPQFLHQFITYIYHRFNTDINYSLLMSNSPFITDHWYWSSLHVSFQVLSSTQKKLINTAALLRRLEILLRKLELSYEKESISSPEWASFMESFHIDEFQKTIVAIDPHVASKSQKDHLADLVLRITNLLLMPCNPTRKGRGDLARENFDATLVDILELIEDVDPNFTTNIISEQPKSNEILDRKELISITSKLKELNRRARNYTTFLEKNPNDENLKIKIRQATRDNFDQTQTLIDQFKGLLAKMRNTDNEDTSSWLKDHFTIGQMERNADRRLEALKIKISVHLDGDKSHTVVVSQST